MGFLSIKKGKSFSEFYELTDPTTEEDFNVAGWSLRGAIKEYPEAILNLYEWDGSNTELENGKATITVDESVSSEWDWVLGYYELELYSDSTVIELDSGRVYAGYEIVEG